MHHTHMHLHPFTSYTHTHTPTPISPTNTFFKLLISPSPSVLHHHSHPFSFFHLTPPFIPPSPSFTSTSITTNLTTPARFACRCPWRQEQRHWGSPWKRSRRNADWKKKKKGRPLWNPFKASAPVSLFRIPIQSNLSPSLPRWPDPHAAS